MNRRGKFVYNDVSNTTQASTSKGSRIASETNSSSTAQTSINQRLENKEDIFEFDDDDDILMTDTDLNQMEIEASRKFGLLKNSPTVETTEISNNNVPHMDLKKDLLVKTIFTNESQRTRENQTVPCVPATKQHDKIQANHPSKQLDLKDAELQGLASQLEEYKTKVEQLEKKIFTKDGEVKMLRNLLDEHRQENAKKSARIAQITNIQNAERSELEGERSQRESCLTKEIENLKTKLGFQEQELIKEQSNRLQSQKVSGSVKRKADVTTTSNILDSENTFVSSQMFNHGKFPRLERKVEQKISEKQKEAKIPELVKLTTNNVERPAKTSLKPSSNNLLLESSILDRSERKSCYLVNKLVLAHTCDYIGDQDETISLLTLLKYPLRHLPDVLEAHSVANNPHQSLTQFPIWQTQMHDGSDYNNEELDFDSGKYNLVSQGIFLLLGLTKLSEKNVDNVGVIHVLVFLELYISSYLVTRERSDEAVTDMSSPSHKTESQSTAFDEHDMILMTLQLIKLLFYSTPGLVKCVLGRTSPAVFTEGVILIHDSDKNPMKNEGKEEVKDDISEVFGFNTVGSFRSLLLQNLQKLVSPCSDGPLSVCHAALEVLVAMTSCCRDAELESIFVVLRRESLTELLAKDCGMATCQHVMRLLGKLVPCKDLHKLLCSHSDECILLKIYQCACEEEDDDVSDEATNFLFQFVQFLKKVALSHRDSIEFLLETDCQCSLEIIRCLVLVLYDKLNYLLDLDIEDVISDDNLSILQTGITVLVTLCTHRSYTADHKLDVEPHYVELIYKSMMLFKNIKHYIPELEALGLQDLLDMEHIDEIEWSLGSDDDDECMVVDA